MFEKTDQTHAAGDGWTPLWDEVAGAARAGQGLGVSVVKRLLETADAIHDGRDDEGRQVLRNDLGKLERVLVEAGDFRAADAVYRLRMDCLRREARTRFHDYRDPSAFLRATAFAFWRITSRYGTSSLRLGWVAFNVGFYFTLLYFVLDMLTLRTVGVHAFKTAVLVSYASFFVIGGEGFFPGTAVFLADTFPAQLLLTCQNVLGVTLGLSWVSLISRRIWRGLG